MSQESELRCEPVSASEVAATHAMPGDAEGLIVHRGAEPVARCILGIARDLYGAPGSSGLVGHYEASEAEAGVFALTEACRRLAARGVARVLGPMDGSTWIRYRLALPSEPGDPIPDPPFFPGEPRNPWPYPSYFLAAGFQVAAHYESRVDVSPGDEAADAPALRRAIESRGFTVRTLDAGRFDRELERLYALCREAFAQNLYYSPIEWEGFRALYEPVRKLVDPELVFLVEDSAGNLVSFLFNYADPSAPQVIAKTLATGTSARGLGLARHLFDRLRRAAHEKGYGSIVHALIHSDNRSRDVSLRHDSRLFRRYSLYEWQP